MEKTEKRRKRGGAALVIRAVIILILALVLVVAGYVIYLQANYYRIEDHAALEVENNGENTLKIGDTYTVVSYNIGFGAYGPDYSFFMDTGEMKDGTKTSGKYGKAMSLDSVEAHTEGAVGVIEDLSGFLSASGSGCGRRPKLSCESGRLYKKGNDGLCQYFCQ